MPTFSDSRCYATKHRSGASALICDSNDNSAGRLPFATQLSQLEGSGMTEPSGDGTRVWEGDIVEDAEGNRTFDGSWRAATILENLAFDAGNAVFAD